MREYIYSIMTDKRRGPLASIIKAVLHVISWFYTIGSLLVKQFYRIGILRSYKPDCKVISVGNISLGGTGKTPTTCMLARRLEASNKNVAVLIRGYGDDEWRVITDELGKTPVMVGQDRIKSSKEAISRFGTDTVILDDGFQHRRIKRDLDIVLVDSSNPFGNGYLFPRGVLREAPPALKRADMIILTKADMKKDSLLKARKALERIVPETPILESVYTPGYIYELTAKKKIDTSTLKNNKIASLSSIVNTEYFEFILKKLGAEISKQFHYPDHYDYKPSDLEHIAKECKGLNIDTVLTTEKDAVKLRRFELGDLCLNFLVLHIEPEITKGEEILNRRLLSLYRD